MKILSITTSVAVLALQATNVISAALAVRDSNSLLFQNPLSSGEDASIKSQPIPGESPVLLCDDHVPKLLTIDHINVSPNPPQKGANLTIEATGTLHGAVADGAYIDVDVRYGYIRLLTQRFDLCEQVQEVDLKCPLQEGPLSISKEIELPNEIPPGQYTAVARAFSVDGKPITCLEAQVSFTVNLGGFFNKDN